jgi:hypothetical protein
MIFTKPHISFANLTIPINANPNEKMSSELFDPIDTLRYYFDQLEKKRKITFLYPTAIYILFIYAITSSRFFINKPQNIYKLLVRKRQHLSSMKILRS